jgi:cytochrome b6-f complex iron-sulfur subunit
MAWLTALWANVSAFGMASVAFLWPRLGQGFGAVVTLGTADEVSGLVSEGGGRYEIPAARMYVVAYDAASDPDGRYTEVTDGAALMALYQKCPHLGCRVPWCASSDWFECPCHGSRYNRWGEYQFGPAPRGMDRFPLQVVDGIVTVDTGRVVTGPARGAGILQEPPTGPHCG